MTNSFWKISFSRTLSPKEKGQAPVLGGENAYQKNEATKVNRYCKDYGEDYTIIGLMHPIISEAWFSSSKHRLGRYKKHTVRQSCPRRNWLYWWLYK